jgi:predicted nucleotidyltransferase component of viral defense system
VRLRDDTASLELAVADVSKSLGQPVRHLRKDFWLTEILRACIENADQIGVSIIFKGGTSLSKVFNLIDRFSEDVDLLVVAPGSNLQVERAMKSLVAAVEQSVGLVAQLEKDTVFKGDFRANYFPYPNAPSGDRGVKLELGNRGGAVPSQIRTITSPVAEAGARLQATSVEEAAPFNVSVLSPARTLVEKLVILHEAHYRQSVNRHDRARKVVRHYYDVYQLLNSNEVREELEGLGTMVTARDVCQHSKALGVPSASYPLGGFATSMAFNRDATALQRNEYKGVMRDLLWPNAALPTFEDCIGVVRTYGSIL